MYILLIIVYIIKSQASGCERESYCTFAHAVEELGMPRPIRSGGLNQSFCRYKRKDGICTRANCRFNHDNPNGYWGVDDRWYERHEL